MSTTEVLEPVFRVAARLTRQPCFRPRYLFNLSAVSVEEFLQDLLAPILPEGAYAMIHRCQG